MLIQALATSLPEQMAWSLPMWKRHDRGRPSLILCRPRPEGPFPPPRQLVQLHPAAGSMRRFLEMKTLPCQCRAAGADGPPFHHTTDTLESAACSCGFATESTFRLVVWRAFERGLRLGRIFRMRGQSVEVCRRLI